MKRLNLLFYEIKKHIPLTAFATIIAIIITLIFNQFSISITHSAFESLHILHILASSIVTAGIFTNTKRVLFMQ
jgi:hypothetical protein